MIPILSYLLLYKCSKDTKIWKIILSDHSFALAEQNVVWALLRKYLLVILRSHHLFFSLILESFIFTHCHPAHFSLCVSLLWHSFCHLFWRTLFSCSLLWILTISEIQLYEFLVVLVSETLGTWHERCLLLNFLSVFWSKRMAFAIVA